jgi:hypothetical protein
VQAKFFDLIDAFAESDHISPLKRKKVVDHELFDIYDTSEIALSFSETNPTISMRSSEASSISSSVTIRSSKQDTQSKLLSRLQKEFEETVKNIQK